MEFNCKFSIQPDNGWFKNIYGCNVASILNASPQSRIKSFIGDHAGSRTNDDVKLLEIVNQPLMVFPRNLHTVFPNLTHLALQSCGFTKITKEDLIGLEKLEHLSLWQNNLRTLPVDLFENMKSLRRVFFGQNPLEYVNPQIFEPIEHILEFAHFKSQFVDEAFDKGDAKISNMEQMIRKWKNTPYFVEPQVELEIPNREQDQLLREKLIEFKNLDKLSDFSIKVRGKEFQVHKAILASQSAVFEEIFTAADADVAKTFSNIGNFSDETFKIFLDYFYSGKLDDEICAMEMFELASVFKVPVLTQLCTDKIVNGLQDSNAPEIFNLGHQHQSDELKQTAFRVIRKMFPDIPEGLIDDQDRINKIIAAKRELEAILADVKAVKI